MISMRRSLLPGMLAALWLSHLGPSVRGDADPPLYNSPASYRLFNPSTMGPRTSGCGRCEPLPACNPGFFLNNPRGTGMDDPWRPPKIWPQTRYPVVPAYARPSYGYYETSWRILPLCNPTPAAAGPIFPAGYQSNPSAGLTPPAGPTPPAQSGQSGQQGPVQEPPLPRPPVVPPAVQPAQQRPPAATPPAAVAPGGLPGGPPTTVPTVPLQPQKATPPTNELQPAPPKATPPAPGLRGPAQGAIPSEFPQRSAMLEPQGEEAPEIRVQPF
jgi:hypothetical protein